MKALIFVGAKLLNREMYKDNFSLIGKQLANRRTRVAQTQTNNDA